MCGAESSDDALGKRIPVRGLNGVPVGNGEETVRARRDLSHGFIQSLVERALERRVTEVLTEPVGQHGTGVLHNLEDEVARDTRRQRAVLTAELVLIGVDTCHHGGTRVDVGNIRSNGSRSQAGSLAIAHASNEDHIIGQSPFGEQFFLDGADNLARIREVGHLLTRHTGDLHQVWRVVQLGDIEKVERVCRTDRGHPLPG